jgi:hypothetical protein
MASIKFKEKLKKPKNALKRYSYEGLGTPVNFTPKEKIPEKFIKQRKAEILDNSWKEKVTCPDWYLRLKDANASDKEIFERVLAEIRKAPTEANLKDALMILMEMSKTREGVEVLKSRITLSLLKEFQRGGKAYAR